MMESVRLASAAPFFAAIALAVPVPAGAHLSATPSFLAAGSTETLVLTVHNDRQVPMTGFALTVPPDFRIVEAQPAPGWRGESGGTTATWRGGSLAANTAASFGIALEAPTAPGPASLEGVQAYAEDAAVRWAVAITVTPPAEPSSTNLGWVFLTSVLGLAVLSAIGIGVLRRLR
jgi:hypothetical protein